MRKIKVWADLNHLAIVDTMGYAETEIEVPDDATTEQIEEMAEEAAAELYTWGWEEAAEGEE